MSEVITPIVDKLSIDMAWSVVEPCSIDLSQRGHPYWFNYYSRKRILYKVRRGDELRFSFDEDRVVGVVAYSQKQPMHYYVQPGIRDVFDPSGQSMYISMLAVLPSYQCKGVGSELLDIAEGYATDRGIPAARLDLVEGNDVLFNFYCKRGYCLLGEVPDANGRLVTLLMEKSL